MSETKSGWWERFIASKIQDIEKEINPRGVPFSPPECWPNHVLEDILKEAYHRENPDNPLSGTLPQDATAYLIEQLNRILNKRTKSQVQMFGGPQLRDWKNQTFPGNGAWTHVDVVENSGDAGQLAADRSTDPSTAKTISEAHTVKGSSPSRPILKDSYQKSEATTLPFNSRSGGSSIGTATDALPQPLSGPPGKPTRGESEIGHSPKKGGTRGHTTRASNRRPSSELASPTSTKRARSLHVCQQCSKTFPFPSKLKDHMHIHEEKKAFPCKVGKCGKAFKRLRELQAHTKTHCVESPISSIRDMDEEMHDRASQSPTEPEPQPPDPVLPKKSPQRDKSPTASPPPGETFRDDRSPTPPRKTTSIAQSSSPSQKPPQFADMQSAPLEPPLAAQLNLTLIEEVVSQAPRADDRESKPKSSSHSGMILDAEKHMENMELGLVTRPPQ